MKNFRRIQKISTVMMMAGLVGCLWVTAGCSVEDDAGQTTNGESNMGETYDVDVDDLGDSGHHDTGSDVGVDDVGNESDVEELPHSNLSGRWAKMTVTSAFTDSPFGGENESLTTSLLLVDLEQDGSELSLVSQICSIDIEDLSGMATTILPQAFVDSLGISTRAGTIEEGLIELPWAVEVRGVEFGPGEDWEIEPLPTDENDPRVIDQDGDGNPGLTVLVDAGIVSGEVYVIQRGADRFDGELDGQNRIAGLMQWEDEQEILGASNSGLLLFEPQSRPNPDEAASYFEMIRLGENTTDCSELISQKDEIFPD